MHCGGFFQHQFRISRGAGRGDQPLEIPQMANFTNWSTPPPPSNSMLKRYTTHTEFDRPSKKYSVKQIL